MGSMTARLLLIQDIAESETGILSSLWRNGRNGRKSDTRSFHPLTIIMSPRIVCILQISNSESVDSTAARPLTHIFITVLWLYPLSPSLHMSGVLVVGLICY